MSVLLWIASLYLAASLLTFAAYGIDKHQATRGQRRIRERTLHLLELAGGWPGAALGQLLFRHKCRKLTYRLVFAAIVTVHAVAWGWFLLIKSRP